jgi:hypothetical protein
MSNDIVIRFFQNRPFIAFAITTSDGRVFDVRHPEQATFGLRGETVMYIRDDRRLEIIESQLIVSFTTLHPASFDTFSG